MLGTVCKSKFKVVFLDMYDRVEEAAMAIDIFYEQVEEAVLRIHLLPIVLDGKSVIQEYIVPEHALHILRDIMKIAKNFIVGDEGDDGAVRLILFFRHFIIADDHPPIELNEFHFSFADRLYDKIR